jgi:hypothetical protein
MNLPLDLVFEIPESQDHPDVAGNGVKQLWIITRFDTFGEDERTTLTNMMKAIHYDITEDVSTIILKASEIVVLPSKDSIKNLILFGILPKDAGLNIDFKKYEILVSESYRILVCDDIKLINATPALKKMLWTRLQEMFLK